MGESKSSKYSHLIRDIKLFYNLKFKLINELVKLESVNDVIFKRKWKEKMKMDRFGMTVINK